MASAVAESRPPLSSTTALRFTAIAACPPGMPVLASVLAGTPRSSVSRSSSAAAGLLCRAVRRGRVAGRSRGGLGWAPGQAGPGAGWQPVRARLSLEATMPTMKITVDAAMRARDVSRPQPEDVANAVVADAAAAAASSGTGDRDHPARDRDGRDRAG